MHYEQVKLLLGNEKLMAIIKTRQEHGKGKSLRFPEQPTVQDSLPRKHTGPDTGRSLQAGSVGNVGTGKEEKKEPTKNAAKETMPGISLEKRKDSGAPNVAGPSKDEEKSDVASGKEEEVSQKSQSQPSGVSANVGLEHAPSQLQPAGTLDPRKEGSDGTVPASDKKEAKSQNVAALEKNKAPSGDTKSVQEIPAEDAAKPAAPSREDDLPVNSKAGEAVPNPPPAASEPAGSKLLPEEEDKTQIAPKVEPPHANNSTVAAEEEKLPRGNDEGKLISKFVCECERFPLRKFKE